MLRGLSADQTTQRHCMRPYKKSSSSANDIVDVQRNADGQRVIVTRIPGSTSVDTECTLRVPTLPTSCSWTGGAAGFGARRKFSENLYVNPGDPRRGSTSSTPNLELRQYRYSLQPNDHPNGRSPVANTLSLNPRDAADENPLYRVSNDFMRMAGYSSQFRNLLQSKKPCRQDSQHSGHGPGRQNGDIAEKVEESSSIDLEKGKLIASGDVTLPPRRPVLRLPAKHKEVRRRNLAATARYRLGLRKKLFYKRTKFADIAVIFAAVGILLMILDNELTGARVVSKSHGVSLALRGVVVASTLVLCILVCCYHACEIQLIMIDSGTDDWRVAISGGRLLQMVLELLICSICPYPGTGDFTWPYIRERGGARKLEHTTVPVDLVLSLPMFLRLYLLTRFMVLHSRLFRDAATRSIAALNRINVDFKFVLKTLMYDHPIRLLVSFTVCFWITMSWLLTQCERYNHESPENFGSFDYNYLDALWLVVITFMSIGYGDIVPNTYCGRGVAITTGIMGIGVASALVAVISRKLDLSKAEKHVNAFMADTKLTRQRKEAAAMVLQQMWFIYKLRYLQHGKDELRLRLHQRRFLSSINEFRRVKWEQRKLAEQNNMLVDIAKVQADIQEALFDLQKSQQTLSHQLKMVVENVQQLRSKLEQPLHSPISP